MKDSYFSTLNEGYHPLNILCCSLCYNHVQEAYRSTSWQGRVVHGGMAVVTAIPVIGQVVSFIELGIFSCMYPSEPVQPVYQNLDQIKEAEQELLKLAIEISIKDQNRLDQLHIVSDEEEFVDLDEELNLMRQNKSERNQA